MKHFCAFFLVLGAITASVKADLLVAGLDTGTASVQSTVLKFDGTGSRVTAFAPGELGEDVQALAVGPGNSIYAVQNVVGETMVSVLDPQTGAVVGGTGNNPIRDSGGTYCWGAMGAAVGPDGYLYIGSANNGESDTACNVFRVNTSTWAASQYMTITGTAPSSTESVAFGPDYNLYFDGSTPSSDYVWKYNTTTKSLSVLMGPGVGGLGFTFGPGGNIFVNDYNSVQEYSSSGSFIGTFVASGSGGLNHAMDLKFGPDGNLYVDDIGNDEILRYNGSTGQFMDVFVTTAALGDGSGGTYDPLRIAFVPEPTMMLPILLVIPLLRRAPRSAHR